MKTKGFTFLIILLSTFGNLFGQMVNIEDAAKTAVNFFRTIDKTPTSLKSEITIKVDSFATYYTNNLKQLKSVAKTEEPAFYIFNRSDRPGFVIVSGDKRIRDVIAYSNTSNFLEPNPGLKTLMNQYIEEISYAKENNINANTITYNYDQISDEAWLLGDIKWDQGPDPFNSNCPYNDESVYSNNRVPAGCGAIALAQILYYYCYPRIGKVADLQNSEYKYELMEGNPNSGSKNDQIATLIYHCGVAQKMNYGKNTSTSFIWNIKDALEDYFNFKECQYHTYTRFESWSDWKQMIRNEIKNKRPVLYKASDLLDGGSTHFFILDDFEATNDLYHVNWGWGGYENDYYSLNLLNPDNTSYEFLHEMIIGIEPANPDITPPQVLSVACNEGVNDNIIITFNEPMKASTVLSSNIIVQGEKSGIHFYPYNYNFETRKFTINPDVDFQHGEKVYITLKSEIQDLVGNSLDGDNNGTPDPDFNYSYNTPKLYT